MESKDQNVYRKGSDNFSKGSNTFFGNLKSISTTTTTTTTTANTDQQVSKVAENNEIDDNSSVDSSSSNPSSSSTSTTPVKPKTFVDGALRGVWSIGVGVVNGAKGIVEQPYLGAKNNGLGGFVKGVAKGVSGVVILPAVGVLEFFSYTTQGIYNTPITVLDAMKSSPKEEEMITVSAEIPTIFFAVELEESFKTAKEKGIPHLLKVCIEFISRRKNIEGIFRISGSKFLIDEIQSKFDKGLITSVEDLDPNWIYEVACIFKSYFRYLPHSVIPDEQITEFYRIQNNITDATEKAAALKAVVNSIPNFQYTILYECISLLHDISLNSKENLMTPSNLSIVYGPSLLRPNIEKGDIQEIANANTIVFNLISFFQQIFIKNPDPSILEIEHPITPIKPMIQK
ncbi:RhoGAP domain-containing protein [Dictyostelium discoideum AX4]|uniref:Rho GTPase-activating protein gacC n=1 Tax=Dictyostelium discoideum TaxID=44689 RepID=GACC_DICDI|nr:RhoGAP domain-containing protein [Dictyostelium discoideum AX4]Q54PG5.1 RecName: Full=Rho GTPase-activating protein gacC; AltName: Full=GTPase activating factor for raC protein C [Dictyostelium discoideum]EAL65154.1 RhoGAP domain-containing protein [Dictyostelium discoideum AX4]|eukprot:XP_638509.1 RhoGAP domain-containing protein [Dictyostelium discoideum AX4]